MIEADVLTRADRFRFCGGCRDEVHLERREQEDGSVKWAILRNDMAWTHSRRWICERMPSSRTKSYLRRARWDFTEAWLECERIERRLGFHLTASVVISKCMDALGKSSKVTPELRETDIVYWYTNEEDVLGIKFPLDPDGWEERELRSVAVTAVEHSRLIGVRVNL